MNNTDTVGSTATGFGLAYAIAAIFNSLLMIAKESSEAVHDGLAAVFGHHWVGHGILDLIVFLVLGFVLSRGDRNMTANGLVTAVVGGTVIGGLIIVGFFGLE